MAEEIFPAEAVYGGSWWSSPRTNYGGCWQNDYMNMKSKSTDESSGGYATAISPDSTCQIISLSPSSTTSWYQALLYNKESDDHLFGNCIIYSQTLPENLNNLPDGGQNSSDFGMDTSYGYNPSSLLQTLFDGTSPPPPQQQQPLYDHFQVNLNEFDTSKAFLWNSSAYEEKPKCPNNIKSRNEEIRDLGPKKSYTESTFKRPRLETPSPLPTFKVRKEKLGDRVTALQQLVSPFGKTDTASVLHEAIEYIKLLQDQVNVLSSPYMKNGASMQVQQINNKAEDEGAKQDLRSRGLCLVPVSSTFPVAIETAPDYWTSGFHGTFN
ncbi:transcription factor bHLH112-like [Bidens hawaiensis]|uniref:transcription factor bHLH112-like n=1 Tax=Bidens hawaiensis TaxID=980011 RepID=UPI0040492001